MMDNNKRKREVFLAHTLEMLELKMNRAADAREVFMNGIKRHHGNASQLLLGAALSEVKLGNEESVRTLRDRF